MYKRSLGHNDVPEEVRNARFKSVEGKAQTDAAILLIQHNQMMKGIMEGDDYRNGNVAGRNKRPAKKNNGGQN